MSPADAAYSIISRSHVNHWDNGLQRAVAGWEIAARWTSTGTILPVFVADANYTPDQVDAAIKAAGVKDEAIEKLGA